MIFNLAFLSLLPLALGASAASFSNDAFCNSPDVGSGRRVCFLNPLGHKIFNHWSIGLDVAYTADNRYVRVTIPPTNDVGRLDSDQARYFLVPHLNRCTGVTIEYKTTAGTWEKQVCNGDDNLIVAV